MNEYLYAVLYYVNGKQEGLLSLYNTIEEAKKVIELYKEQDKAEQYLYNKTPKMDYKIIRYKRGKECLKF